MQTHKLFICIYFFIASIIVVACKDKTSTPDEPPKICPFKPKHPMDYRRIWCEEKDEQDIATCVQRCESDHPDATMYCKGAWRFFSGQNEQEMRRLLMLSCEKGSSMDCLNLADSFVVATRNPQLPFNFEKRGELVPLEYYKKYLDIMRGYYPLVRSRCDTEEDPMSCSIISMHYEVGGWPPKYKSVSAGLPPLEPDEMFFQQDKAIALEYQKKACAYGAWGECDKLARTTKNHDEAVVYMSCACENADSSVKKATCEALEEIKNKR
jgi:hypothetical protein